MNGDGDDVAQERRIWWFRQNNGLMYIERHAGEHADHYTLSELRDLIERRVENGTNDTIASSLDLYWDNNNGTPLTEQECTLLCRSCQPFLVHHLKKLYIRREWKYLEASYIVRHMSLQSSTIDRFEMIASEEGMSIDGTPMPMTMRALRDELPDSLRTLELLYLAFTSEDCQFLGQMISNKERALNCVMLKYCSFPRLADFLTLIAGFAKDKIPSDRCSFYWCSVKDGSILKHEGAGDNPLDFGYIFGEFWQRHDEVLTGTYPYGGLLHKAAHDLLDYFRPMQQAGLWSLLPPPPSKKNTDSASAIETRQPRERREWVKMFGHEAVNGRVDLLFHILLLNPEVCVL